MRSCLFIPLLAGVLVAQTPAPVPVAGRATPAPPTLQERLQSALRRGPDDLRQFQGELALAAHPRKTYYEALVAYALAGQTRATDPKGAAALVDRALAVLAPARDADSLALHAGLLGLKLGFDPSQGMTLAPRALALLEEARAQAPENPRVRLFLGIHLLHTPVAYGGGPEAALPALKAAAELAQAPRWPGEGWTPVWGRIEALAWLALTEASLGQRAQAEGHLAEALALDPGYGFARGVVAPRLKAPLQGGRP